MLCYLKHEVNAHAEIRTVNKTDVACFNQAANLAYVIVPARCAHDHRDASRRNSADIFDHRAGLGKIYAYIGVAQLPARAGRGIDDADDLKPRAEGRLLNHPTHLP